MALAPRVFGRWWGAASRPRRVVYTCLFGYSEQFNDFAYESGGDIDFICFTDDAELQSDFWTFKLVDPSPLDPARASERIKVLPHQFLSDYDWTLYIDNTIFLKMPPQHLFDAFLAQASSPLVCFRHHERNCVYDEAEKVIELSFDDPARVRAQMAHYRELGYPVQNGLAKGAFLLRRHHDPALVSSMERWYQQIVDYSKRDQLSLNPAMWLEKFNPTYLAQRLSDFELLDWPVIKDAIRLPRDFEDARYLQLHRDVNFNTRRHYLNYGIREGRAYK